MRVDAELFKAAAKRVWMHAGDLRRAPSAVDASARMREHLFEVGPLHGVEIRHLFGSARAAAPAARPSAAETAPWRRPVVVTRASE